LLAFHRCKIAQETIQRVAVLNIIDERLDWNTSASEAGPPMHDALIDGNHSSKARFLFGSHNPKIRYNGRSANPVRWRDFDRKRRDTQRCTFETDSGSLKSEDIRRDSCRPLYTFALEQRPSKSCPKNCYQRDRARFEAILFTNHQTARFGSRATLRSCRTFIVNGDATKLAAASSALAGAKMKQQMLLFSFAMPSSETPKPLWEAWLNSRSA